LPAYLVVSQRPELEKALSPFFPAGVPQSASSIFLPSALKRMFTFWNKDDNYVNTYNQMFKYEMYNYQTGKRSDVPTNSEIASRTNKFFFLRALQSLTMPVSVSPEIDFYNQQYRNLQAQYANYRDPATGKLVLGMAEAKFLQMYPDFFQATVSLSKNPGGLEPNANVIANLRKHSGLMQAAQNAGDPELMGFLAGDGDNQYTFSQASYRWLQQHGAVPGTTYIGRKTPDQLMQEANVKRGWNDYQNFTAAISSYEAQNGITPQDPRIKQLQLVKQIWLQSQAKTNLDWYSAYVSPDKAKYERRAQVLEKAITDKNWMAQNGERPVVKNLALYLDLRKQVAGMLQQRYEQGGSRSMSSQKNADIAAIWQIAVQNLTKPSPETEQFINRYFANDSAVL
jgi:hypothetical protein